MLMNPLEDGHIGVVGPREPNFQEKVLKKTQHGGRLGFRDMEALGDKAQVRLICKQDAWAVLIWSL